MGDLLKTSVEARAVVNANVMSARQNDGGECPKTFGPVAASCVAAEGRFDGNSIYVNFDKAKLLRTCVAVVGMLVAVVDMCIRVVVGASSWLSFMVVVVIEVMFSFRLRRRLVFQLASHDI